MSDFYERDLSSIKEHLEFIQQHGPCKGLKAFFEEAHAAGHNLMIHGVIWPDGTHTSELIECPAPTAKSAPSASPAETSAKSAPMNSPEPLPKPSQNT